MLNYWEDNIINSVIKHVGVVRGLEGIVRRLGGCCV